MRMTFRQRYNVVCAIWREPTLGAPAKLAASVLLLKFMNKDTGRCRPSYETIAAEMGVSRSNAFNAVAALKRANVICRDGHSDYVVGPDWIKFASAPDSPEIRTGTVLKSEQELSWNQDCDSPEIRQRTMEEPWKRTMEGNREKKTPSRVATAREDEVDGVPF
ncbi:helix-turn-helix domain-containing protein [Acuticoccus sediminis]|uniref:helix-turn-helix domain-containing protein n=1 Tax=Acuticoccus sediminis TaxID=2184697 RepID=UPI001CFC5056|nr:helix-turn-helix domain-containing protein [Acuticoccus sediminis]